MTSFLLTSDPGLEDIAAGEIRERVPGARATARPFDEDGLVRVELDGGAETLLGLATVHHVVELRAEARADGLDDVARAVAAIELPDLAGAPSFRVTSRSGGAGGLSRMDLQRVAGAAIHGRHGTPVDLEGFAVNVRVDVYGRTVVVGVQHTRTSLGKRIRRVRALRTALKPTIAAAMIRIAGAHRGGGSLIDPLCGTGTIPIEAKSINPDLEVHASDWDPDTLAVARGTLARHGLDVDVRPCDARCLDSEYPQPFDYIVTDPPYGVRQARRSSLEALYVGLLQAFERALAPRGRIVLVALKLRTVRGAIDATNLSVVEERRIESGGLHPRIFVLERSPDGVP